ncbi:transcription termination factor NusA [Oscillospiraceae bacterium OttesenSCG-928-G22]|nr:transcription termination factor NusA [Oscillospiraceae bacterium OttesenSCG-928-G22]
MNAEFFDAISDIEKEKGIPKSYMLEKIAQALITAYRRDSAGTGDNVVVEPDEEKKEIRMYVQKEVVDEVEDPSAQILLEEAQELSKTAEIGDVVNISIDIQKFGRIAAQTAKQVIVQGIREAERGLVFQEYTSKEHELLPAVVQRVDHRTGNVIMELGSGNDKTEALLLAGEQMRGEELTDGDRVKVYVVEVRNLSKGPQIIISRSHPGLVKRLFELEVPEIHDGIVEIKSIAREAGLRTKMAVYSNDENVDPIGACIGPRGARVGTIVDELGGEKIDIVKYSDDPAEYIAAALSPAEVLNVALQDDGKACLVTVPDDQLSLAIGREGQNARLSARLTGYKIDIKSDASVEVPTGDESEG